MNLPHPTLGDFLLRVRCVLSPAANRLGAKQKRLAMESLEPRQLMAADVVINEIHYDPPDKTQRAEFVELFNNSDNSIDLSSWHFSDGVDYTFPAGTTLGAGQYLVVAEDPATARQLFGVEAVGPWNGALKNSGEVIELRDGGGTVVDRVDYARGFPWPTVGDEPGHSIELIHPDLDNELGGNWRRAGTGPTADPSLLRAGTSWKYLPGTAEPSSPRSAWRTVDFDDSDWEQGVAPIGYGDGHVATNLPMRGNYSTVYLRQRFTVDNVQALGSLTLRAQYDDGFNLWINGQHLVRANVSASELSFRATATSALENTDLVEFVLPPPGSFLVEGTNVIAVQLANASLNGSSDAWFDAELVAGSVGQLSPASPNTVLAANAPPATRKVSHGSGQIGSGQDVPVTVKVTDPDGVAAVTLEYQIVKPGDYFGRYLKAAPNGTPIRNPRYDDPQEWTTLVMNDDGADGDQVAGDSFFTAVVPAAVNQHRHLVRYRIQVADNRGLRVQVPYADDPQHNFAYFVYDGPSRWTASAQPGVTPQVIYDFDQLRSIATYQLLTTRGDHEDSQHIPDATTGGYTGSEFLWPGTMIYDGQVYDNIRYRARGGVWRYAMGKNMWKFDFNRGHGFQAKNNYGQPYSERWDRLNFSALIQQGDFLHRGEQGLFESVGFKLFNLAGVESPHTHYVNFRVIDGEDELGDDQFSGDFQGLYLAIEQPDGHLLDEHNLPDGNLYKIERHVGSSNNQGPTQVSDGSDVAAFIDGYRNGNPTPEWWRAHLDLDRYYSYRAIVEGVHHYDIAGGKNYYYYHHPETGKFSVHPWDLDLTWADNMFGTGQHDFASKVARNDAFEVDYQNRVRELVDLLLNREQTGLLIDEFAALVDAPDQPSWVDADRAMWDYNPIMVSSHVNSNKAGHGRFYEQSPTGDFQGMAQKMKDYVDRRARRLLRILRTQRFVPQKPALQSIGHPDFPINALAFRSTDFADPDGADTFAAMEWRIAEITDPENPRLDGSRSPQYEITPAWESGMLTTFNSDWSPPAATLTEGALYRVRVRMQDVDGHWSHWSDPVQFTAGRALPSDLSSSLRISEVHYHPADPSPTEQQAGFVDPDEFEFIEMINVGAQVIDLSSVSLTEVTVDGDDEGVNFEFSTSDVTSLAPGERLLVVEDIDAFTLRYGSGFRVAGQWRGKLSNGGERLTVVVDDGRVVQEFSYDDAWYPATDGPGFSLEVLDPRGSRDLLGSAAGWLASVHVGGSPGSSRVVGDLDSDLEVVARDIDLLSLAVAEVRADPQHDLNGDRAVDEADIDFLIREVLNTFRGDADLDGKVSFADFLILSATFGQENASWALGDFTADGKVSFADFLALAANFGAGNLDAATVDRSEETWHEVAVALAFGGERQG